jgi:hypothetical protein
MEPTSADPVNEKRERYVARLITSGPTVTGDCFVTREAVEGMVEQLQGRTLPMGVEHDPTQPPVGRILGGELVELDNGEVAVESTIEMFEPTVNGRVVSASHLLSAVESLPPVPVEHGPLTLRVDPRSYALPDLKAVLAAAEPAGPVERHEDVVRFSVLPDPLLVIAITPAFWFTKGSFTKLGENAADDVSAELKVAYKAFKRALRQLVAGRNPPDRAPITLLTMTIDKPGGGIVEVEGSCRRADETLDDFLDSGSLLYALARAYLGLVLEPDRVVRMHFRFSDGRWMLAYALDDASERVAVFLVSDDEYAAIANRVDADEDLER